MRKGTRISWVAAMLTLSEGTKGTFASKLNECLLWMAPAMQEVIRHYGALVGCSLLSGLLMQPFETAGPDGVGELGPNLLIRL